NVTGIAQTQERVSELLRNTAYNSEWLVKPELIESKATTIQANTRDAKRLFDFSVRLAVKRPQDAPPVASGAAASAVATSASAIPAAVKLPVPAPASAVVAKKT
ncbi:MAG TPA: PilN domain-containing protein, partial [Caldimonas sp.]